jgi:hypothetical protein
MKILEFEDFIDDSELNPEEKAKIKEWVKKYEKYFNYHDTHNFADSIEEVTDDCLNQLGIEIPKREKVKYYLENLYDLSDGLSVVMAPDMQFQYNDIDQVQRFQY